jgi:hypothetical protein
MVQTPTARWVNHEIVRGESLGEIAERYAVTPAEILHWNELDPNRPVFWVGERLKIHTVFPERLPHKLSYIVHPHDSWETIAERFDVDEDSLRKSWNPSETLLQPGHQLTIWLEPGSEPALVQPDLPIRLAEVPLGATSLGYPDAGRLLNGVQIPENPTLYTLRNLEHAYGSTHAINVLQQGIAAFRLQTGFDREVVIWDMSVKRGGRFGPHRSHRTGRDVDISLLLRPGFELGSGVHGAVDWEANWHLIRAFIESGSVHYVFLSRAQQAALYKAAQGCGASAAELDRIIQYPRTTKVGIVRHSPGHEGHLHVRFSCGEDEPECSEF